MINDILFQASNFWLAGHLSEWCTKSDLVLLGHCKITSHQNVIKISMKSNLNLKFDKIYPFNLESERYTMDKCLKLILIHAENCCWDTLPDL